MLNGVHILLTYKCLYRCDHCFLYSSPEAPGTFSYAQLRNLMDQMKEIPGLESVYFEGGEPFLYYPLLLKGIEYARRLNMSVGIVTNAFWGTSVSDAEIWLKPLADLGISDLSLSNDYYHYGDEANNPAKNAQIAAEKLGLPVGTICIEGPVNPDERAGDVTKGEPITGGDIKFVGRASETLIKDVTTQSGSTMTQCPQEDLENPGRVHIDAYGHVHVCQGISIGNVWKRSLSEIMNSYVPGNHPICGPLHQGGPAQLAETFQFDKSLPYIDECHMCYTLRKRILDRFPDQLTPGQVYGISQ